jgi:hypothetical protein
MAPWRPGDGEVGNGGGGGRMRGSGVMNWTTNRPLVRSGWAVDGRKARAGDPTPDLSHCLQVRVRFAPVVWVEWLVSEVCLYLS